MDMENLSGIPSSLQRKTKFLQQPVFNSYHSETELLRYIHLLQSRDLSLTHSMIALGSCTMKLNATSEMEALTQHGWSSVHPFQPADSVQGYHYIIEVHPIPRYYLTIETLRRSQSNNRSRLNLPSTKLRRSRRTRWPPLHPIISSLPRPIPPQHLPNSGLRARNQPCLRSHGRDESDPH